MTNKEKFLEICSCINRQGIAELLDWLEKSDFYYAPASMKFHGSYAGGLLEHSLNVYRELKHLLGAYQIPCTDETAAIIALFHDLCKVNLYSTERRNRKNANGQWEAMDAAIDNIEEAITAIEGVV